MSGYGGEVAGWDGRVETAYGVGACGVGDVHCIYLLLLLHCGLLFLFHHVLFCYIRKRGLGHRNLAFFFFFLGADVEVLFF